MPFDDLVPDNRRNPSRFASSSFSFSYFFLSPRTSFEHTTDAKSTRSSFFFLIRNERHRERERDREKEEGEAGFTAKITTAKWVRKVSRASGDLANVAGDGEAESGSGAENRRRSLFSPRLNTAHAPPTRPFGNVLRTNALKTRSYISPPSLPVSGATLIDQKVNLLIAAMRSRVLMERNVGIYVFGMR